MSINGLFPIGWWDFKSHSILTGLPPDDIKLLTAHMSDQHYSKGEVIFREDTFSSGIFFIRNGKVKKYKADKEGREQIIYVANTGELIGYHALLAEERYPDSAAALEDCLIPFIPKEDFLEVLHPSHALSPPLPQLPIHHT